MPVKIVICRPDLPSNPSWLVEGYPGEACWDIDELMRRAREAGEGSELWREARRIFWECMWRLWGRYKRGRPFFEVYEIADGKVERIPEEKWRWVCMNVVTAAMAHDLVPPEAKARTYRIYRRLFGPLVRRRGETQT